MYTCQAVSQNRTNKSSMVQHKCNVAECLSSFCCSLPLFRQPVEGERGADCFTDSVFHLACAQFDGWTDGQVDPKSTFQLWLKHTKAKGSRLNSEVVSKFQILCSAHSVSCVSVSVLPDDSLPSRYPQLPLLYPLLISSSPQNVSLSSYATPALLSPPPFPS